jgi:hypothetical protein
VAKRWLRGAYRERWNKVLTGGWGVSSLLLKASSLWSASRLPGYGASESYAPQRLDLLKRLELRTPVRSGCNRPTLNFQHGHVYLTLLALRYSGSQGPLDFHCHYDVAWHRSEEISPRQAICIPRTGNSYARERSFCHCRAVFGNRVRCLKI